MKKEIKNILIKGSGDVTDHPKFRKFAEEKAENNYVVIICGAGTKINNALKKGGYDISFDDHGRKTNTWHERQIVRDVLENEERRVQDQFIGTGVFVVSPILNAGSVLCHINGDNLTKAYYLGFDEIYVFTREERAKEKREIFKAFPKVEIIGI